MPILDLQIRARELGRIRLGQVVPTSNGKTRPSKLSQFRFTSYSRELLQHVARLYGGEVHAWQPQGGGPPGFEVITDATRVPILVPPQPVSQWYETWSGGGCTRRCDGTTEVITDQPCLCDPDPERRECKPTTRLNVMLRDVPGLGVWRLESHGYYAAVELPAVAEFLARTKGYLPAALVLEERVVKRKGVTLRYLVPAIEVEAVTPGQLVAGQSADLVAGQPIDISEWVEVPERPPLPALSGDLSFDMKITSSATREELLGILDELHRAGLEKTETDRIVELATTRAHELGVARTPRGQVDVDLPPNVDDLWVRILSLAPDGWTSGDVETEFTRATGVAAEKATAEDMQAYLNKVT
jgi:hypothetical protein